MSHWIWAQWYMMFVFILAFYGVITTALNKNTQIGCLSYFIFAVFLLTLNIIALHAGKFW